MALGYRFCSFKCVSGSLFLCFSHKIFFFSNLDLWMKERRKIGTYIANFFFQRFCWLKKILKNLMMTNNFHIWFWIKHSNQMMTKYTHTHTWMKKTNTKNTHTHKVCCCCWWNVDSFFWFDPRRPEFVCFSEKILLWRKENDEIFSITKKK